MRRLYVTLQDEFLIDGLLNQDVDAVREPFHELFYDDGLSQLMDRGAGTYRSIYARSHETDKLPFVPGLGALRLSHKAQLEHRAFERGRGLGIPSRAIPCSPTGLRLFPRASELVSEHRLEDTYRGRDDAAAGRRVMHEGHVDYFVGDDESTWHLPASVEPRRRISVSADTDEARHALGPARLAVRAYLHVYPYGMLTVTLCVAVDHGSESPLDANVALLRSLIGRRDTPGFTFEMHGFEASNANEFIAQLARRAGKAIEPGEPPVPFAAPRFAVSVAADREHLSDRELAGLLTLDDRYELFDDDWVAAQASLYGRYHDRVCLSRSALAVATSPRHFPPSGRRRFFWRLHAIREFARCQATVLTEIAERLRWTATRRGLDEQATTRLLAIGEHLIEFHRGLPAHHRKWFYECQHAERGTVAVDAFYASVADLHQKARDAAMLARMDDASRITINIDRSQIANLNLGTISGNVEAHLSAIPDDERAEIREALATLAQAVVDAPSLPPDARRELLESIDLLAEEAVKEPDERRSAAMRPVLATLADAAAVAGDLASVWGTVGPVIVSFFA
jgi:hypothetical protein